MPSLGIIFEDFETRKTPNFLQGQTFHGSNINVTASFFILGQKVTNGRNCWASAHYSSKARWWVSKFCLFLLKQCQWLTEIGSGGLLCSTEIFTTHLFPVTRLRIQQIWSSWSSYNFITFINSLTQSNVIIQVFKSRPLSQSYKPSILSCDYEVAINTS